eukprot:CAMPEP_0117433806 /NCGR_PEP_ID=MMETSP0758-20121206/13085_1 /TAXON_ID=63605 /ORGANISM="Percolomonas cosmopolitus, Strain AE-1 (ATCC 50343)" /LENGTH=54 /DNA_ID=CAMNT_0005224673 /DNA_START=332 /DNA_END=493 /DNA_ORIENTATION=+
MRHLMSTRNNGTLVYPKTASVYPTTKLAKAFKDKDIDLSDDPYVNWKTTETLSE